MGLGKHLACISGSSNSITPPTHLDRNDRLWLFGEDDPAVQERGDNVVDQEVNFGRVVLLKVLIHIQLTYHSTRQQAILLPLLIVLLKQ